MRRARLGVFVVLAVMSALVTTLALAQPRPAGRRPAPAAGPRKPLKDAGANAESDFDAQTPMAARAESTSAAQVGALKDAGAVEAKTLDGGGQSLRFVKEVEIEGRLRSPQLVYFLRRVRAEFAAGDLGHRTFMRELSDTKRDPSF